MAVKHLSDLNPDGTELGQTAADLVSFHGADPVAQSSIICLVSTATAVSITLKINEFITYLRLKGLVG